jgi:hypothetical protein
MQIVNAAARGAAEPPRRGAAEPTRRQAAKQPNHSAEPTRRQAAKPRFLGNPGVL